MTYLGNGNGITQLLDFLETILIKTYGHLKFTSLRYFYQSYIFFKIETAF